MTIRDRSTEQPDDQSDGDAQRPTLAKETIQDLEIDDAQAEALKGGSYWCTMSHGCTIY
jgi:hypothetical protein